MANRHDELTAFEESIAERTAGMSLGSLGDPMVPKIGLYGALAWVHVKRTEPTLKYDDYMKRVKFEQIMEYLYDDDEEPAENDGEDPPAGFLDGVGVGAGEGAGDGEGPVLPGDESPAV